MDTSLFREVSLPEEVVTPLLTASKSSSSLIQSLQILIETTKSNNGRKDLASTNTLPTLLRLIQSLPYPCNDSQYLLLSLKLLRNLCAGEIVNQDLFVEKNGVEVISCVLRSAWVCRDPDYAILRMGLQVLANVSLTGERHQLAVWNRLFPEEFIKLASVPSRDTCDPLCMIIYTCCDGSHGLVPQLCRDEGLVLLADIVRTASAVGFGEDWLKLLLSRICIDEVQFGLLFVKLQYESRGDTDLRESHFSPEQAFLLKVTSEIVNDRMNELTVLSDFALCVLEIFKTSVGVFDSLSRANSGLPTGSAAVDVLGYSLTILRDICARDDLGGFKEDCVDIVDTLLSSHLLELLLCLLRELEPPAIIRKSMKQSQNLEEATSSSSLKPCPYKGFRRDIVAVIGNCVYRRKHVQDEIREKDGILLMLQQCVTDEDNPFLREWGIWSVRNLLEGNAENQRVVSDLEIQGSVDVPELAGLGMRVEVDQKTRRVKLVNVPAEATVDQ